MAAHTAVWRESFVISEGPRFVEKSHQKRTRIGRETPEVLAVALGTEDRKLRWELLKNYAELHPKRCSLKSWAWLESKLMAWDVPVTG